MTGGTPEVRSDLIDIWYLTFHFWHLTYIFTFQIWHLTFSQWTNGPMNQWTNGLMDQWTNGLWTNGLMVPWTNGPMDQWTNGPIVQWTNKPMDHWSNQPMIQCSNGPMDRILTQCSIAISRLGWDILWVLVLDFFLFKWTCSLFWVWRRHSLTVRIFSQKSITKW